MAEAKANGGDRIAGGAMIAAAALSVLAMAHHPSGAHDGGLAGLVHGVMIVLLMLTAFGFAHFALRRGLGRPAIHAGLIAYLVSAFAHVGAATINGFVVPALAARGVTDHNLFLLAWEGNQALARLGVFATGTAYLLWALDFLRRTGFEAKAIGALGLLAGLVPAALLASGIIVMNVAGASLAYAAFGAWAALVGQHMLRGRLEHQDAGEPAGGTQTNR